MLRPESHPLSSLLTMKYSKIKKQKPSAPKYFGKGILPVLVHPPFKLQSHEYNPNPFMNEF